MTDREIILERIQQALRASEAPEQTTVTSDGGRPADWLPQVGTNPIEWWREFQEKSVELRADCHKVGSLEEAVALWKSMATTLEWKSVASHRHPLLVELLAKAGHDPLWVEDRPGGSALEACDVGLTACDALVAQTGSVLISSVSAGGRSLSVLPPHHVVLATAEQMLPDLPAAFELLRERYESAWPSLCGLITGPSRTGDIERILVLGAHGPRRLTIIILDANGLFL